MSVTTRAVGRKGKPSPPEFLMVSAFCVLCSRSSSEEGLKGGGLGEGVGRGAYMILSGSSDGENDAGRAIER